MAIRKRGLTPLFGEEEDVKVLKTSSTPVRLKLLNEGEMMKVTDTRWIRKTGGYQRYEVVTEDGKLIASYFQNVEEAEEWIKKYG